MGVREDGITLVDNSGSGPGTSVDINSPIGSNTKADSVSITIASDEGPIPVDIGATGTLDVNIVSPLGQTTKAASIPVTLASDQDIISVSSNPPNNTTASNFISGIGNFVIITPPDGYNSVLLTFVELISFFGAFTVTNYESAVNVTNTPIYNVITRQWISGQFTYNNTTNYQFLIPVIPGKSIFVFCSDYTSGTLEAKLIASTTEIVATPLTNEELRASALSVTGSKVIITDGVDDADVIPATSGKGLQIHSGTKSGGSFSVNDPLFLLGAINNVASNVPLFRLSQADASTQGLQTVTAQGEANTVAKAWPILITDGTNTATVKTGGSAPSFTNDKSLITDLRVTENEGSGAQTTRFIPVGGLDSIGRGARFRLPASTSTRGGYEYGAVVRNVGPDYLSSQVFNGSGQLLQQECRPMNQSCFYIDVVDGGGWNGTLTPSGYITSGPENNIRAYDIAARLFVDTLSAGKAYYVLLFGASLLNIRSTNYVGGTCTVRIGGATNGAQFLMNEILNAGALVTIADTDRDLTTATNNTLSQTPEGYLRTLGAALVSDVPESYIPGDVKPLSVTQEGRLRVSSVDARIPTAEELYPFNFTSVGNPWEGSNPWGGL